MQPTPSRAHKALGERIKAIRTSLHGATDPDKRDKLLDDLGAATRELTELVLLKKGKLRSPLE